MRFFRGAACSSCTRRTSRLRGEDFQKRAHEGVQHVLEAHEVFVALAEKPVALVPVEDRVPVQLFLHRHVESRLEVVGRREGPPVRPVAHEGGQEVGDLGVVLRAEVDPLDRLRGPLGRVCVVGAEFDLGPGPFRTEPDRPLRGRDGVTHEVSYG